MDRSKSLRSRAIDFGKHGIHVRLFHFRLVGQNIAHVVRHRRAGLNVLQKLVERFLFIRQLNIGVVRFRFRGRICLIDTGFIKLRFIDSPDLERGSLRVLGEYGLHRLETCPVKISAERDVQSQGNNQSKPQPIALFAARKQTFGLKAGEIVEVGNSHCFKKINE